jgi:putative flippase GtrA
MRMNLTQLRPNTRRAAGLPAVLRHRELRRFVAFLVAGGLSAMVTLSVTSVLTDVEHQRFLWAVLVGTEVGILVNFTVNDRQTFRDLAGHRRSLPARVLRFHVTCATGQTLIVLCSLILYAALHWRVVFAQGLPIVLVTGVNFAMHRFWTYRQVRAPEGEGVLNRWRRLRIGRRPRRTGVGASGPLREEPHTGQIRPPDPVRAKRVLRGMPSTGS